MISPSLPFAIARALACAFAIPGWRQREKERLAQQPRRD